MVFCGAERFFFAYVAIIKYICKEMEGAAVLSIIIYNPLKIH